MLLETPTESTTPTEEKVSCLLGWVDWDDPTCDNERVRLRVPGSERPRFRRHALVRVVDVEREGQTPRVYLGRIVDGPFFPPPAPHNGVQAAVTHPVDTEEPADVLGILEIQGELHDGLTRDTQRRPAPGSQVHLLRPSEISELVGSAGDMLMGSLVDDDDVMVRLSSRHKGVLPRNIGIFGTVGSGKSNTCQVLVEEAALNGWAVVVLDVEGEYLEMDQPTEDTNLLPRIGAMGMSPRGLPDFAVYHPASCPSERRDAHTFHLRLSDFETAVIAEILEASIPESNALQECVEFFLQRHRSRRPTTDADEFATLLDSSPQASLPFNLGCMKERAGERAPRGTEYLDFGGLSSKLARLKNTGAFDQPQHDALDVTSMLKPRRVNVIDISVANDIVKNLVTADLLRKAFAYKILNEDAPPTLIVLEEAHSFISREHVETMQATLQMLRSVARRGRKRWLGLAFVSQQPGHLPAEIFELCNTRLVHNVRSMHNLDALMATAGDVGQAVWSHCPMLGPGEAVLSAPQLRRPVLLNVRPAISKRKFVR